MIDALVVLTFVAMAIGVIALFLHCMAMEQVDVMNGWV